MTAPTTRPGSGEPSRRTFDQIAHAPADGATRTNGAGLSSCNAQRTQGRVVHMPRSDSPPWPHELALASTHISRAAAQHRRTRWRWMTMGRDSQSQRWTTHRPCKFREAGGAAVGRRVRAQVDEHGRHPGGTVVISVELHPGSAISGSVARRCIPSAAATVVIVVTAIAATAAVVRLGI